MITMSGHARADGQKVFGEKKAEEIAQAEPDCGHAPSR
jgi:hypothetical protein